MTHPRRPPPRIAGRDATGTRRYPTQGPRPKGRRRYVSAQVRRRRAGAALVATGLLTASVWGLSSALGSPHAHRGNGRGPSATASTTTSTAPTTTTTTIPGSRRYAVGTLSRTFDEPGRSIVIDRNGAQVQLPRQVGVTVWYPALASTDIADRSGGPYPLVVFGPGYLEVPSAYSVLLRHWAAAGFVVAGITFPRTNPAAPGGPTEADLPNQPGDVSYVINQMLADTARPTSALYGMVSSSEIAVAGQSDGGNTALAVGYDSVYRDPRVKAVVVLSGAQYPFQGIGTWYGAGSPPLLAVQGTADTINPPAYTNAFFGPAPQPKYLLCLAGAAHLSPYTSTNSYEQIVARTTTAFLDQELYNQAGALARMSAAGNVAGLSSFAGQCQPSPPG